MRALRCADNGQRPSSSQTNMQDQAGAQKNRVPNIFKINGKWSQLQMCTGWPNSIRVIANHALKCLAQLDTSDSQPFKCTFTDTVIHANTVLRESQCNTEPMQTQTQRPDRPSPKGASHGITHNPQLSNTHRQQPRHNSLH